MEMITEIKIKEMLMEQQTETSIPGKIMVTIMEIAISVMKMDTETETFQTKKMEIIMVTATLVPKMEVIMENSQVEKIMATIMEIIIMVITMETETDLIHLQLDFLRLPTFKESWILSLKEDID